jgi:hypothetical protein
MMPGFQIGRALQRWSCIHGSQTLHDDGCVRCDDATERTLCPGKRKYRSQYAWAMRAAIRDSVRRRT